MPEKSHWLESAKLPRFPNLGRDLHVNVVVVGGGITGVTAAYLLKQAGKTVALLERDRCCEVDTGHTTAHLTYVTDDRISELVDTFGKDHARAAWDAGQAAIDQIYEIARKENLDCGFSFVPGYQHASWNEPAKDEAMQLQKDAQLARDLGFDATYLDSVPFADRPGIRFANQARFHPLRYLAGLLPKIAGDGSHVFENTEAEDFEANPLAVKANGRTIRCDYLVIATHVPLMGIKGLISSTLFQTKLASFSSYAVGAKIPKGSVPDALFFDTTSPYYYLRLDGDYAIFGGEDNKTGQEKDANECYANLEELLLQILPEARVQDRWTGQVVESTDGLPYIGEVAEKQFIATAFAGNGMTFGTLAAMMAVDAVTGRRNPWKDLFDPSRKKLSTAWDYIKENFDYPYYLVKSKLQAPEGDNLDVLQPGEGKILKVDGHKVAAYKNPAGEVCELSPTCTHMGCNVQWNKADSTWDCPCHGSRFQATGEVLTGPAETPLEPVHAEAR